CPVRCTKNREGSVMATRRPPTPQTSVRSVALLGRSVPSTMAWTDNGRGGRDARRHIGGGHMKTCLSAIFPPPRGPASTIVSNHLSTDDIDVVSHVVAGRRGANFVVTRP